MRICSGFGDLSEQSLAQIFTDVCNTDVEADGLQYLPSSIRVAPIRPEDPYGGLARDPSGAIALTPEFAAMREKQVMWQSLGSRIEL